MSEDARRAIEAVRRGAYPVDRLLSHTFPFSRIQEAFETATGGDGGRYLDFDGLEAEILSKQGLLEDMIVETRRLQREVLRPLYHKLHPQGYLETLMGVGEDSAAVYLSFIGDPHRFANASALRGWSGMVPRSSQSGTCESKGLHISQAGPNLIKYTAFLNADVARRYDPQLAKVYYDQMVHKGKHHNQALCTCATHLLDRVLTVWREDRPYEVRDVDGKPVTWKEARHIIATRYTVPPEIRQRNSKRARQERRDRRAERQEKKRRESRPSR